MFWDGFDDEKENIESKFLRFLALKVTKRCIQLQPTPYLIHFNLRVHSTFSSFELIS